MREESDWRIQNGPSHAGKEEQIKNIQARNGWVIQKHPSTECEKHFKMIQAKERRMHFKMIQAKGKDESKWSKLEERTPK